MPEAFGEAEAGEASPGTNTWMPVFEIILSASDGQGSMLTHGIASRRRTDGLWIRDPRRLRSDCGADCCGADRGEPSDGRDDNRSFDCGARSKGLALVR